MPDFLFRRAKSAAAQRGIPLRQLVTEAIQEKLKTTSQEKPWMKHVGRLKHLHKDRKQIERRVEEALSRSIGKSGSDSLEMILDTNALSAAADDDPGLAAVLARAEQMRSP